MNKYQKSLNRIAFNFGLQCLDDYDDPQLADDIANLTELVNKATPKKPMMNVVNAWCPNCNEAVGRQFAIDGMRGVMCRGYCPHCGQALDWRDDQ